MQGGEFLEAGLSYYGISPWEIEVAYGYLNSRFSVTQTEVPPDDPDFVSMLEITIPLPFSTEFFEWFDFARWEKLKALFKEMKRRRGSGKALKILICFKGDIDVLFVVDALDRTWYNNAVEKIDFVLELLPYHLDSDGLPSGITRLTYIFEEKTKRWVMGKIDVADVRYLPAEGGWRQVT